MTKRTDVLPQDLVNSQSRGIRINAFPIFFDIWQAPRQKQCGDACQISERY